jgi:hypothetical protein
LHGGKGQGERTDMARVGRGKGGHHADESSRLAK